MAHLFKKFETGIAYTKIDKVTGMYLTIFYFPEAQDHPSENLADQAQDRPTAKHLQDHHTYVLKDHEAMELSDALRSEVQMIEKKNS